MAVLLGVLSSALWGGADFLGGLLTRRRPSAVVVLWSQVAGFIGLLGIGVWRADWAAWAQVLPIGLATGVCAWVALLCFYTALATGTMGIVAPVTSIGVVVPVAYGLATGDRPSSWQSAGIALAVIGIVLASGPEVRGRTGWRPLLLALVAAAGFGAALTLLSIGSQTDVIATLGVERVATSGLSLLLLLGGAALRHRPWRAEIAISPRDMSWCVGIGAADVGANVLFGVATTVGLLPVVSVASSLYPVATVLLAAVILKERLARVEIFGVALSLLGVALIAGG